MSSLLSDSLKARRCAALAVMDVMANKSALEPALERTPDYKGLEPRDRAFARVIAATVFRRSGQIKAALKPYLRKRPPAFVMATLQTAVAQIVFLKTPAHAAVGETVDVLKSRKASRPFANLANAVLRNVVSDGEALCARVAPSDNVPGWIRGEWERNYGKIATRQMSVQLIKDPVLDLSVPREREDMVRAFKAADIEAKPIGAQTVRLNKIGDITRLPGFSEGRWWAQDLAAAQAAQILIHELGPKLELAGDGEAIPVLDLCAAPGGKTLQLAARGLDVTAVDKSATRLLRLEANLARMNLSAKVICADALTWESSKTFAGVLLDAPCSATGTYRRHPDVLHNRDPRAVADLVRLQDKLLARAALHVGVGGILVYAVCSLQVDEGAPRITKFLDESPEFSLISQPQLRGLDLPQDRFEGGMVRLLPSDLAKSGGMDGFFIAAMRRES